MPRIEFPYRRKVDNDVMSFNMIVKQTNLDSVDSIVNNILEGYKRMPNNDHVFYFKFENMKRYVCTIQESEDNIEVISRTDKNNELIRAIELFYQS